METTLPAHERVAGEVRAEMARRRISGRRVARELGWTVNYAHRRFSGETPLDVNDLAAIAAVLDVPISTFIAPLDSDYSPSTRGVISGSVKSSYLWPLAA
jgi:transcriptional regulator with XRE-family HTH domain